MEANRTRWNRTAVTSIALAFEHEVVRGNLCELLELEQDFQIVAVVSTVEQAQRLCRDKRPDVMIVDLDMPVMNEPGTLEQVMKVSPSTKVMAASANCTEKTTVKLLLNGVSAIIPQDTPGEDIPGIIRLVSRGVTFVPEKMRTGVISSIVSYSRGNRL